MARCARCSGSAKNSAGATETSLGLRGNFGSVSVMGLYNLSESAAGSKAKVATLGATYALGATLLKAGWGQADVDGVKTERLTSVSAKYSPRSALRSTQIWLRSGLRRRGPSRCTGSA